MKSSLKNYILYLSGLNIQCHLDFCANLLWRLVNTRITSVVSIINQVLTDSQLPLKNKQQPLNSTLDMKCCCRAYKHTDDQITYRNLCIICTGLTNSCKEEKVISPITVCTLWVTHILGAFRNHLPHALPKVHPFHCVLK